MELNQAEKNLLTSVQMARKSRQRISPQAETLGVDLEGAYRVQAALGDALPQVKSASVFATDLAFCRFKRGRDGRSGLAEQTNNSMRGMEFEAVAKADIR